MGALNGAGGGDRTHGLLPVELAEGIEPSFLAYHASVIPLYYASLLPHTDGAFLSSKFSPVSRVPPSKSGQQHIAITADKAQILWSIVR